MTYKENIKAILECYFTGFKEEIIESACNRILEQEPTECNCEEPKTGRWIMPVQDDGMSDPIYYQIRCSECGFDLDPQTWHMELHQYGADKFCPNCGAKMYEPQESEE